MDWDIRKGSTKDKKAVFDLYRVVSREEDGIIREPEEITLEYVSKFMTRALENGILLLVETEDKIIGEIHGYPYDLVALRHCITDVTIVVHPDYQSRGIGKQLLRTFLQQVESEHPHILRVELYTREHNHKTTSLYNGLGFKNEGRQESKILTRSGTLETPLHMVWFNSAFNPELHKKNPE